MKKTIISLFVLCLTLLCATMVLVGCGPQKKDPSEIIGVYSLKQMEVIYNDGTKNVYNVDYENNESEMLKKLSKIIYNNLNYRYELEKNSEDYVFSKKFYNEEIGNYVSATAKPVTPEWESANEMFILKAQNDVDWYYIYSNEDGYYYVGSQFNIINTDFEVETLRGFMQENDIDSLSIWYVLEK